MMNIDTANLRTTPFSHLAQPRVFDADFYSELRDSYPSFDRAAGWSRMTKDLMRGDPDFERALQSPAWKSFHDHVVSPAFLDEMTRLFRSELESPKFMANLDALRITDYIETRSELTSTSVPERIAEYSGPLEDLFVRMDFGVGEVGYSRPPHLDWRHRVCSALFYFDSATETSMVGGDLILHDTSTSVAAAHTTVRPEHNLAVLKLDDERALHSVSPITSITGQRRTVYVGLSSRGRVWA
jgi:hypothetical protein